MTKGEFRVQLFFNPGSNDLVSQIKRRGADLIDLIDSIPADEADWHRWKAEAMTNIETGAMYAVKAAAVKKIEEV
jgi:hypothetical protein